MSRRHSDVFRERAVARVVGGEAAADVARDMGVDGHSVRSWVRDSFLPRTDMPVREHPAYEEFVQVIADAGRPLYRDKKVGTATFEDFVKVAGISQHLKRQSGWAQQRVTIDLTHRTKPILVVGLADTHIGSWGADMEALMRFTRFIVKHPDVYVVLVGDLVNLAIKMRGVLEVKDDMYPPEMQHEITALWLDLIGPKVLCAGWGNHDVEREEMGSGASLHKYILSRRVPWFNGIGHADVLLGPTHVYKMAISHRFRGSTTLNPTNGHFNYMQREAQDREVCFAGDLHQPEVRSRFIAGTKRVAVNMGALQLNSGFAQRYFSQTTEPEFPCVELHVQQHMVVPFMNIHEWLATTGQDDVLLEMRKPAL